ncbi:MAG: DUF6644 family protein [Bryobacteraceae bacterium]
MLSFFAWCENTPLGEAIRDSRWLFPVIESVHLLGLAVIGGAVLIVNLRLLGFGIRRQPVAQLWRDTRPWMMGSLAAMLISGMLLFTSEATKLYYHDAFWVKMISLLLAMIFTFTVMRKVALADPDRVGRVWGRAAALVSILLWSTVGVCGRWIGFS